MVDAADLKSATSREVCGFESLPRHQRNRRRQRNRMQAVSR